MLRFRPSRPGERSRRRATRALFTRHGMERTPEGRSLRLLRQWLSPGQRTQFAKESYFEVVGSDTGKRYRIYAGAATNVCELDESGRPTLIRGILAGYSYPINCFGPCVADFSFLRLHAEFAIPPPRACSDRLSHRH